MIFYPLTFNPIFKERIWGGTRLASFLDKQLPAANIGESWEISAVPGDISIVNEGDCKGKTLNELLDLFSVEILGTKVVDHFGKNMPLLFKFIDAQEDLSIQVHPGNELAMQRHGSLGKTEMWYVLHAATDARMVVGFRENCSAAQYMAHVQSKTLPLLLKEEPVKAGDVFFLETGTIHAIGSGILVAEIQQSSDITYRIYDWDRLDQLGQSRELHIDLALDAMNYQTVQARRIYTKKTNEANPIVDCPYFTTDFLPLQGHLSLQKDSSSFVVYMCVEGCFTILIEEQKYHFKKGVTVLMPAILTKYQLEGTATLLVTYIK